ncbi:MAG TPA: adenylate cyclase [Actinomycetota bacterium]|nr:adenylate cyclase [Actinomycetota bacterium]
MPTILTDDKLQEVLGLLRGADSVELKLTIPDDARSRVLQVLGIDPLEARIRQVFFFDTPELTLDRGGVVVRARRIQDAAADTTVKLRPVVPDELPKSLRRDPAFTVEVDAMPGGFVCSGSLKGAATNDEVLAAATGGLRLRKLLGKAQRALFAEHAPDGIALDDLAVLGPINVLKLKMIPKTFGRKITVELWNYPDGSRILELSTKCAPADAFQVAAEIRARVAASELDLSGEQQTKTKAALRYFSKQLTE